MLNAKLICVFSDPVISDRGILALGRYGEKGLTVSEVGKFPLE